MSRTSKGALSISIGALVQSLLMLLIKLLNITSVLLILHYF